MLTRTLKEHCGDRTGVFDTFLPLVQTFRLTEAQPKQPTLYEPSIVFLGNGQKFSYAGSQKFVFDNNNYLCVGGNFPLDCEYDASPSNPILGVILKLDIADLQKVYNSIYLDHKDQISNTELDSMLVTTIPRSEQVEEVLERLLIHLKSESRTQLFGYSAVRELYWTLLCLPQENFLRQFLHNKRTLRISKALEHVQTNFKTAISINELAKVAHMSEASFYRAFKQATGITPLQLIKNTRLAHAKRLLQMESSSVKQAAHSVGYQSVTHFSQDFRRRYGTSPGQLQKRTIK